MAIYDVQAPDGSVIQIEGPDNATQEQLAQAVNAYAATLPPAKPEMGFFEGLKEHITGTQRTTPESQTLPEWTGMPELNQLSWASAKTGLGTLLSNPKETVQVIKANFPDTEIRQDEKGNYILKSSIDQKEYVIPPGFSIGDIPRAAGGIAAFTPAGRTTSILGGVTAGAGTQTAIEASQAATGGQFNAEDVAMAGAAGGIVPAIGKVVKAVSQPIKDTIGKITGKTQVTQPVLAPTAQSQGEEVGSLIQKAVGKGTGATKAQEELAAMAKVNPEAKAAADRLGIELPADVFSDSPMIREAAGLTRSVAGSEASGAWRTTVTNAVNKADDLMAQIDGSTDIASVSDAVISSLKKTREGLAEQTRKIYDQVDMAVPKEAIVQLPKLRETLQTIQREVGEEGLSSQEKKMLAMLNQGNVTYGRLAREKNLMGQALAGKESPYGNMESGALKRLYASLAEDQLTNVNNIGGSELRDQLRGANLLFAKQKGLEKRIINSFGKESEGSIANLMKRAIETGAKGDSTSLTKLLKVVPPELHKETVASALMSVTRAKGGAERGGFGFAEFANVYRGLRNNAPVYAQVAKVLGPENHQMLTDLYAVSKRITDARANVLTTGKANQALVESMKAEGLVGKVMESAIGKAVTTGAGAVGGGPAGAMLGSALTSALTGGKKDVIASAGKLFNSQEFQNLAIEAATKSEPSKQAVKRVVFSRAFKNFADKVKLPRTMTAREQWILSGLQTEQAMRGEQ